MPTKDAEIYATIGRLTAHYSEPTELLKAIRKEHPKAMKKEIMLAVFAVMIDLAESDPAKAKRLHSFGISQRGI